MFIGISQRIIENNGYPEIRECLALDWGVFFREKMKGFLPLPLSYEIDFDTYIRYIDGVILSGGNDLSIIDDNYINNKRDSYEFKIIEMCIEHNIPLLGICHGAQIISHYFGSILDKRNGHVGNHKVIFKNKEYNVNSYHNYCIVDLGKELDALIEIDSTIEAFKHNTFDIYGIMWHIEREFGMECDDIFQEWFRKVLEKRT